MATFHIRTLQPVIASLKRPKTPEAVLLTEETPEDSFLAAMDAVLVCSCEQLPSFKQRMKLDGRS